MENEEEQTIETTDETLALADGLTAAGAVVVEETVKPKKRRSTIDPATGDKRKTQSAINIVKAREARLEKLRLQKQLDKDQVELDEESDGETELVIQRQAKTKVITPEEARLLKLELALQQLALQQKIKEKRTKKVVEEVAKENLKAKFAVKDAVKEEVAQLEKIKETKTKEAAPKKVVVVKGKQLLDL